MNLYICSSNTTILSRWQDILSTLYENIFLCNKENGLADYINSQNEEQLTHCVFLYHLPPDVNEEKNLYQFLSQFPIAKQMLVLVNSPDSNQGIRLLFAGVHGYANVYLNEEKLKSAVKVIEQGEIWAGEDILLKLLNRHPNPTLDYQKDIQLNQLLSNREKQILDQVLQGKTNKEVGTELNITERTVKAHLTAIFKKTGTRNRFELNVKLKSL